jgi:hypothetical protein
MVLASLGEGEDENNQAERAQQRKNRFAFLRKSSSFCALNEAEEDYYLREKERKKLFAEKIDEERKSNESNTEQYFMQNQFQSY